MGWWKNVYNLFNNSEKWCGIIEMWETGRGEEFLGKFSFRMRENIG